jgi:prepilin-type N-terminal cleavage/methylation domain-containing protein
MTRRTPSRVRRGMTILEVVVALSILTVSLIGTAEYGRRYTRSNTNSQVLNQAIDLATARIERVKAERNYTSMDTLGVTETVIVGYPKFTRVTTIVQTLTGALDYKTVTVKVIHSSLPAVVKKTTAVALF